VKILREERKTGYTKDKALKVEGGLLRIPPTGKLLIVGDIHGDLESLLYILKDSKFIEAVESEENLKIIFLGDYGDRGDFSPEVYYVVSWLKVRFPGKVVLLRGNHEPPGDLTPMPFDLPYQLSAKYGKNWEEVYRRILELFETMPHAALIEEKYLLLHGGVPSKAENIGDLAYAHEKHPSESHLEEILWSDPEEGISGTLPSPRGAGKLFGANVTRRILNMVGTVTLIRGHLPADEGVMVNHEGIVLTIFSRKGPPYFNSRGAYLKIDLNASPFNAYQLCRQAAKF
jgi:protein phosphatase